MSVFLVSWLWPPFGSYRFPLILSVLDILAFLKWGNHITAPLTTTSGLNPVRLHERSDVNVYVNFTLSVFLSNIRFLEMLWPSVLILTTLGPKNAFSQNGDLRDMRYSDAVPLLWTHKFVEIPTCRHADTLNIDAMWRWVIASYCGRCTSGTCWTTILGWSCLWKILPLPNIDLDQCFSTAGPGPGTGPWHQLYRAARGSPGICRFSFLSNFHE